MRIVKTKTSDGLYLRGLFTVPNEETKKIIIHIHGMAGSPIFNEYYQQMHDEYSKNGIAFLVPELRGTGIISEFVSDDGVRVVGNAFEKFEDCVFDIHAWIDFARREGFEEIWLQSHSLGTSKVAYYVSTHKNAVAGLIFISPSDMIGLVHDEVGVKDHKMMLPEAKRLVHEGKGKQLIDHQLWGAERLSAETYLNFFDDDAKTAIFNYGNEALGWDVIHSIQLPVLAISGTKDDGILPVIDPYQAMKKLEQELIHSPRVKTIVFENAQHSFDGFSEQIVNEVLNFIT